MHRQFPRVLVVQGKVSAGGAVCDILKKAALHALAVPRCKDAEALLRGNIFDAIVIERTSLDQCPCGWPCKLRERLENRHIPLLTFALGAENQAAFDFGKRLRAFLRRHNGANRAIQLKIGNVVLDPISDRVTCAGREVHLSPTEFRLLSFFMQNTDRILERRELFAKVWGGQEYLGRTVDIYVGHLRQALADRGDKRLIRTVRGRGYVFSSEPRKGSRPARMVRTVAQRHLLLDAKCRGRKTGRMRGLRPRERSLLELLILNPGTTFSREAIADFIWGPDTIDLRTVDATVSRLREAIAQRFLIDPIRGVPGKGYQMGDHRPPRADVQRRAANFCGEPHTLNPKLW